MPCSARIRALEVNPVPGLPVHVHPFLARVREYLFKIVGKASHFALFITTYMAVVYPISGSPWWLYHFGLFHPLSVSMG